ncbi:MAG: dihydrolipoamide acetyltransferase family protein [Desulfotignum sp.]
MFEFKLPDLGEGIHEGELLQWHVREKEAVTEDDPLCDMETDKAAVTIPSPKTGTIHRLKAKVGDLVQVGQVLVEIDTGDAAEQQGPSQSEDADSQPAERSSSGSSGKRNAPDQDLSDQSETEADTQNIGGAQADAQTRAIAAPAVRRLAREMDIDINQVPGTGPGGRVTADDLVRYEKQLEAGDSQQAKVPEEKESAGPSGKHDPIEDQPLSVSGIPFLVPLDLPDFSAQGPVETVPIRSLRRKTAVKTVTAAILVPHVAHMDEADVTELENLRQAYNTTLKRRLTLNGESEDPEGPDSGGNLTLLAFVIKAVTGLLKAYPAFNASVDTRQMQIIYKKFYHIGFAADTPKGLMVPVIQDADRHSLAALGYRIRHLARAAREGKIRLEDLTGSTFSVTNVGAIGGTHVVPVINYPETAILGMGRVEKKPVVRDDAVVIRQMLPLTLCFDHRVADGVQAARFVRDLKAMLEDPALFMTHT